MIFPLAEILKVFFALEWVFTFGISSCLQITLLVYPALARSLMGPFGLIIHGMTRKWSAKVGENVKMCKFENVQMDPTLFHVLPGVVLRLDIGENPVGVQHNLADGFSCFHP